MLHIHQTTNDQSMIIILIFVFMGDEQVVSPPFEKGQIKFV